MYRVSRDLYGKRKIAGQGRLYGMGDIKCLRTDAAGNCTLIDDSASDVTVTIGADGAAKYSYTESGKAISFGSDSLTSWLNKNVTTVALGAGAFFLLFAMTKR